MLAILHVWGYNTSEEDVKKLRSGLVILLECFSVVLRGNAFHGSQREKIEEEVRLALLQLRGKPLPTLTVMTVMRISLFNIIDATEADALLSALGDINFGANVICLIAGKEIATLMKLLWLPIRQNRLRATQRRVECAYFIDMDERAHWAGLSHAFL